MNRMGRRTIFAMLLIAAFVGLIFASILDAFADDLTGQASIIDGDTLEIHGMRIRLWGVDAPETDQLCRSEGSEQKGRTPSAPARTVVANMAPRAMKAPARMARAMRLRTSSFVF